MLEKLELTVLDLETIEYEEKPLIERQRDLLFLILDEIAFRDEHINSETTLLERHLLRSVSVSTEEEFKKHLLEAKNMILDFYDADKPDISEIIGVHTKPVHHATKGFLGNLFKENREDLDKIVSKFLDPMYKEVDPELISLRIVKEFLEGIYKGLDGLYIVHKPIEEVKNKYGSQVNLHVETEEAVIVLGTLLILVTYEEKDIKAIDLSILDYIVH
mgnify:CR=1 FL=1